MRARNADHDLVGPLGFRKHEVAVIGFPTEQLCPACSARPAFAGAAHSVSAGAQSRENRAVRRNGDGWAAETDPDAECLVLRGARAPADAEILEVHRGGWPMTGHVADRIHQRCRATAVNMCTGRLFEYRPQI